MENNRRISEAELTILEALWDAGEALPVKAIREALKGRRGWDPATVSSLVARLTDKGALTEDRTAKEPVYRPTFARREYAWDLTQVLLERLYGNNAKALVSALLERGALKPTDLSRL